MPSLDLVQMSQSLITPAVTLAVILFTFRFFSYVLSDFDPFSGYNKHSSIISGALFILMTMLLPGVFAYIVYHYFFLQYLNVTSLGWFSFVGTFILLFVLLIREKIEDDVNRLRMRISSSLKEYYKSFDLFYHIFVYHLLIPFLIILLGMFGFYSRILENLLLTLLFAFLTFTFTAVRFGEFMNKPYYATLRTIDGKILRNCTIHKVCDDAVFLTRNRKMRVFNKSLIEEIVKIDKR